jgi:hypothetical protein
MLEDKRALACWNPRERAGQGDDKADLFRMKLATFISRYNKLLFDATPPYQQTVLFFEFILEVFGK